MRKNIFLKNLEGDKGITLIEITISIFIFAILILATIFIFKETLYRTAKVSGEKKVFSESIGVLNYIEKYITASMCNDKEGLQRINFQGKEDLVRFIAPFYKGPESDLAKFSIYFKDDTIKVSIVRINNKKPDFSFPETFSGAQTLGENISVFKIKYYDGTHWKQCWDTETLEEPVLPKSVKISLVTYSKKIEGKRIEKEFTKIINITW